MAAESPTMPNERALSFTSHGIPLIGVLCVPPGESASLGAVIIHGWSSYRSGPHHLLVALSRSLAEAGVATLRFDVRGRGDSQGRYEETDLDGMIADARTAAEVLRKETGCGELAAVGLCSGGNVAIGAATLDTGIRDVVAISTLPFQSHTDAVPKRGRRVKVLASYARKLLRPATWRKIWRGEVNYQAVGKVVGGKEARAQGADGRNLKDSGRDIMADLARFGGRLLFVWGGADADGAAAYEHYSQFTRKHRLRAEYAEIEGANHNFYGLKWKQTLIERVVAFLTPVQRGS
jgi:dienelactone hydrolase